MQKRILAAGGSRGQLFGNDPIDVQIALLPRDMRNNARVLGNNGSVIDPAHCMFTLAWNRCFGLISHPQEQPARIDAGIPVRRSQYDSSCELRRSLHISKTDPSSNTARQARQQNTQRK
jgi:hypothetical protein